MAAQPDAALHVPLERQPGVLGGHAAVARARRRWLPSSAPVRRRRRSRSVAVQAARSKQLGDDADAPEPLRAGAVDGLRGSSRSAGRRGRRISSTNRRSRGVRAPRYSRTVAEAVAVARGPRRSAARSGASPMPPATIDDVAAVRRPRPASRGQAGRAAPSDRARRERASAQLVAGARGADRQLEAVRAEPRDRDRRGGEGRQRDHDELAGPAAEDRRIRRPRGGA